AIETILHDFTVEEISEIVRRHVETIVKLCSCGILSEILDETIFNFYGYTYAFFLNKKKKKHTSENVDTNYIVRLSQIFPNPQEFIASSCNVDIQESNGKCIYLPLSHASVDHCDRKVEPQSVSHTEVLSSAIGYRELLIALLAHHKTPIGAEELENEFKELFGMSLNCSSPHINRLLKKINDPTINQEQKQLQQKHASDVWQIHKTTQSNLRCALRGNYNSLKSMIHTFRLAANFELYYDNNLSLFELLCPKCRQDNVLAKSPFK
ncbi:hypothetical protein RFI_11316, partial [Reticulomyxa filosa]